VSTSFRLTPCGLSCNLFNAVRLTTSQGSEKSYPPLDNVCEAIFAKECSPSTGNDVIEEEYAQDRLLGRVEEVGKPVAVATGVELKIIVNIAKIECAYTCQTPRSLGSTFCCVDISSENSSSQTSDTDIHVAPFFLSKIGDQIIAGLAEERWVQPVLSPHDFACPYCYSMDTSSR
jgi:hypothetical protein